jgi:predicted Rossmann fold nucleotide-binding protein DprA/Smf involved in DNA uptake
MVARLWLDLTRQLSGLDHPKADDLYGVDLPDLLISIAVYLAMVEEQAMTATQLARTVGLPRTTVLRRLAVLEHQGRVERRGRTWRTPLAHLSRMEQADLAALAAFLRASTADLPP